MQRFVNFVMLAHGWRRILLLVMAGTLAGLSVPPLFILPALFVTLPILVWSLDGAERAHGWRRIFGSGFAIGFWFALGYFSVAIHWVGFAFFAEGGWIPALAPLAVLFLAALLALFWGFGTALAHLLWSESGYRIVVLAASLALAEFARGHLFTGFPFDLLGYALTANPEMMQAASLVGVYGLTFVAPLVAMTPALIWPALDRPLTQRLVPFFAALALLAVQVSFGAWRLAAMDIELRDDMRVRMVQPNIDEAAQWQAADGEFVLNRLIDVSEAVSSPTTPGLSNHHPSDLARIRLSLLSEPQAGGAGPHRPAAAARHPADHRCAAPRSRGPDRPDGAQRHSGHQLGRRDRCVLLQIPPRAVWRIFTLCRGFRFDRHHPVRARQ